MYMVRRHGFVYARAGSRHASRQSFFNVVPSNCEPIFTFWVDEDMMVHHLYEYPDGYRLGYITKTCLKRTIQDHDDPIARRSGSITKCPECFAVLYDYRGRFTIHGIGIMYCERCDKYFIVGYASMTVHP